jgi:hypothetical protein
MTTKFSSTDRLGLRQRDPLEKWRADAERREEEFARERRYEADAAAEERRVRAAAREAAVREPLEARLAALEAGHHTLNSQVAELARTVADDVLGMVEDQFAAMEKRWQAALEKERDSAVQKMRLRHDESCLPGRLRRRANRRLW